MHNSVAFNCRRIYACVLLALAASFASGQEPPSKAAEHQFFEQRVRPVLVTHCQKCHGPEKQESGLRVDSLAALLQGGEYGAAVVPGKPEESLLVGAINHGEILQMPPKTKLPAATIADLTTWVKQGAAWPDAKVEPLPGRTAESGPLFTAEQKAFWAFQPPREPALPAVQQPAWCRSPIDSFILAGLEAKGLHPAPPADKRTLIRRATFDLLGLPPTPEDVAAFLADESPDAFERVIDRLLASARYGERWGRHWLDVARYADSNGMDENVAHANAFRYRDYVIASLNGDKPYDQFVREQLAGDLLPDADPNVTLERLTATGFLVIGPKMLAEDDPQKMEMDIVDEQLDTAGRVFMGLTLGCARCHDHKFDPLPTADYYSLAAIFKSTKTMENFKVVAMWNERPLASPEQIAERDRLKGIAQAKKAELEKQIKAASDQLRAEARSRAADYLAAAMKLKSQDASPLQALVRDNQPLPEGAILLESEKYDRGNVVRDLETYGQKIGVVYNAGPLPNVLEHDFAVSKSGVYQLDVRVAAADARPTKIIIDGKLLKAEAAGQVTGSWHPDGQRWFAECLVKLAEGKHVVRLERDGPFPHFDKLAFTPTDKSDATSDGVQSVEQVAADQKLNLSFLKQWLALVRQRATAIPADELTKLAEDPKGPFTLPKDVEAYYAPEVKGRIDQLRSEVAAAEKAVPVIPTAMAATEGKVENLKVHLRGNYLTLGAEVPRRFPQIMAREDQTPLGDQASGRLELANWLTQPDHPLTSRVMVNRVWHWHFGHGIVRSPDNFGRLGELPDHPELLDYLATQFVRQGWSLKALHREIMLSSTYRMSTQYDAQAAAADPENRLHWRHTRRRLEAEAVRDAVLAVSDELDATMGGSLLGVNNHAYVTSTASENYDPYHVARRSVYLPITRSSVFDFFQAFDFADPSMSNGQRDSTTVSSQALALMNSRLIEEQTNKLAQRLLDAPSLDDTARVHAIYERCYSRPPTAAEVERSLKFVQRIEQSLLAKQQTVEMAKRGAWQSLCRVVLASSEFVYVE